MVGGHGQAGRGPCAPVGDGPGGPDSAASDNFSLAAVARAVAGAHRAAAGGRSGPPAAPVTGRRLTRWDRDEGWRPTFCYSLRKDDEQGTRAMTAPPSRKQRIPRPVRNGLADPRSGPVGAALRLVGAERAAEPRLPRSGALLLLHRLLPQRAHPDRDDRSTPTPRWSSPTSSTRSATSGTDSAAPSCSRSSSSGTSISAPWAGPGRATSTTSPISSRVGSNASG